MQASRATPMSALELCQALRLQLRFDPRRLDRILRVDEERGMLEVQAATPWMAIASGVRPGDPEAASVRTSAATVGESIARNAAGPDGRPAVLHVESMALVTPDGHLRRVSRGSDAELFALAVGGQGLFGVPYSITLRMESLQRAIAERLPVERQAEPGAKPSHRPLTLLLPPDRMTAFLDDARARCEEWRTAVRAAELRPVLPEEDTFLRWACRGYRAVDLWLDEPAVLGGAVRATQLRQALLDAAIGRGGSFLPGSTPEATRAHWDACYPQLPAFLAHKRRLDPDERIVSGWYRRVAGLVGGGCDVRWSI